MVATRCFTYNHAPYIEDALRGFAKQETTFPVVYIIVDDASTDGEPKVLKKWASDNLECSNGMELWKEMPFGQLAVAPLVGKLQSLFVIVLLAENHTQAGNGNLKFNYIAEWYNKSKYHALCEGDDYWINSKKLQMQVGFLESHTDYVLCHTDFDLSNGGKRNHTVVQMADDNYFPDIITKGQQIGTATTMFLKEAYDRTPKLNQGKGWRMGDLPMWIELSREGKIKYIPEVTTCYRILDDSASHGSLEKELDFLDASVEIRKFYADFYGVELRNGGINEAYFETKMRCAYRHNSKQIAKKCMKNAIRAKMVTLKTTVYFVAAYLPIIGKIIHRLWR